MILCLLMIWQAPCEPLQSTVFVPAPVFVPAFVQVLVFFRVPVFIPVPVLKKE
jgi:hypothetical protein